MNSEGKGKRVLGRLGIPLATSYIFILFIFLVEVLASTTHRRKEREGGSQEEAEKYKY